MSPPLVFKRLLFKALCPSDDTTELSLWVAAVTLLYTDQIWADRGFSPVRVCRCRCRVARLKFVFVVPSAGLVAHSDLDERAIEALKEFNEEGALQVLVQFKESDLSHVQVSVPWLLKV